MAWRIPGQGEPGLSLLPGAAVAFRARKTCSKAWDGKTFLSGTELLPCAQG